MRQLYVAVSALFVLALAPGCGGHGASSPDASAGGDSGVDAPFGADGIAAARAASDGTALSLPITGATITYLKPAIGSPASDPAGFTIQAARPGPALFVAVDPATLTPPGKVGDVVDFTITAKATVAMQPRAQAITGYTRTATGASVAALTQDLGAATDVVSAVAGYDSEVVSVTATVTEAFTASGTGFQNAAIKTTGITADPNFQIRAPVALVDALDMVKDCQLTLTSVPVGRFNARAQLGAFASSDVTVAGCPAPTVVIGVAQSPTSLRLVFTRNIKPSSVKGDGSQFTLDHGLTVSAAVVVGRTITLTTAAQDTATAYKATILAGVTDLQGTAVAAPTMVPFAGYAPGGGARLSVHTTLGIPAPASNSDVNAYLSVKPGYVLSYNSGRKVPNWVAWELNSSYIGTTPRQDTFRPDDTLPGNLPQAQLSDYSGSGYDRGHMCPSADRTLTITANSETFYLSNMVPQAANNNQGPWEKLESESRTIVSGGKELFIVSGGVFSAGSTAVGNGVGVPDATWKVVVVLDAPGQGAAQVTGATRVIAIVIPNNNAQVSKADDWRMYRVSVDAIEAMTGYNLLSDVDPAVQAVVEARVDNL